MLNNIWITLKKVPAILAVSFSLSFVSYAASINVNPLVINLTHQVVAQALVESLSSDTQYIKVSIREILNPGMPNQQIKEVTAEQSPFIVGLAVTPKKIILPPKSQHLIQIMAFGKPEKSDRVYLVDVVPIKSQMIVHKKAQKGGEGIAIGLLEGYGIRVMVRPADPLPKITYQLKDRQLILKNEGNSNVFISRVESCKQQKCTALNEARRLYAGNTWKLALPKGVDKLILYKVFLGEQAGKMVIPLN